MQAQAGVIGLQAFGGGRAKLPLSRSLAFGASSTRFGGSGSTELAEVLTYRSIPDEAKLVPTDLILSESFVSDRLHSLEPIFRSNGAGRNAAENIVEFF